MWMKKPSVVAPTDAVETVGEVFGTPVVVKGKTWFPLTEFAVWLIMACVAGKNRPDRPWWKRLEVGGLMMLAILGSEWCHNLAHAAAAKSIGRPMDAMRVTWGMPLVVYYDVEDDAVAPREHIVRALGGPIFNGVLLIITRAIRRFTPRGSSGREIADTAVGMNLFLSTASLLPIPGIDGGPILKWALVERGYTKSDANEAVKGVDRLLGVGLGAATGVAVKKRRWLVGAILGVFSVLALAVGFGLIEE
jgi:Zn-dependent protease